MALVRLLAVIAFAALYFCVSGIGAEWSSGNHEIFPPAFIIGGNTSDIQQHPYQVAIWSNSDFRGSGALVGYMWVITTASLLVGFDANTLSVRAYSSFANSGGAILNVSRVLIHPKFRFSNMTFDVALLRVRRPSFLTSKPRNLLAVQEWIPLAHKPLPTNSTAVLSGWGSTTMWTKMSDQLLQTVGRPVNTSDCQQAYDSTNRHITNSQFCAIAVDVYGPCWGDSGDLLVYDRKLYGLLSFNQGCYDNDVPSVFTDIPSVYRWVYKVMKKSKHNMLTYSNK